MATTIKPLHDRVIIKRIEDSTEKTAGGLFIPDSAKEKPQEGEVIAAGEGKYREDGTRQVLDVKTGDTSAEVIWEANDVPSGVYLVRFASGSVVKTLKIVKTE